MSSILKRIYGEIPIVPACASCYNTCMAGKKISTTVYLTEEQLAALKELNARTKVPIAEYIRMGIDLVLERNADDLPGQISLFGDVPQQSLGYQKKPKHSASPESD